MDVARAVVSTGTCSRRRASGCVGMCEGSPAPPDPYVGASALVTFCRGGDPPFEKVTRPRGRNKKHPNTPKRRATPRQDAG